jgi:hypothetical protein
MSSAGTPAGACEHFASRCLKPPLPTRPASRAPRPPPCPLACQDARRVQSEADDLRSQNQQLNKQFAAASTEVKTLKAQVGGAAGRGLAALAARLPCHAGAASAQSPKRASPP